MANMIYIFEGSMFCISSSNLSSFHEASLSSLNHLLVDDFQEEGFQERATGKINDRLERTMTDTKNLKRKIFEETVKRWKEEDNAMEAKCKVITYQFLTLELITSVIRTTNF